MSNGIGEALGHVTDADNIVAKTLAHGLSGGLQSMASGGNFGSGFAGNALSTMTGYAMNLTAGNPLMAIGVSGLSGGAGSMLAGGSFGDGFLAGAEREMYNDLATDIKKLGNFNKWIDNLDSVKFDMAAMALAPFDLPAAVFVQGALTSYKQFRYDALSNDCATKKILSTGAVILSLKSYKMAISRVLSNLPILSIDVTNND